MALTSAQETKVKKMLDREKLLKDIEAINKTAYTAISAKNDEINALENKRIADVKAKRDAITALNI